MLCSPVSPKDEAAADQVVGEVMAHQAFYRCGPLEREPGDGHLDKGPGPTGRSSRENFAISESLTGLSRVPSAEEGFYPV